MDLVTVIIPCFNVEEYLEQCLESVRVQTYSNLEILVVNDGSTDGTERVISSYVQKDIRFHVINKVNGGLSSARNAGLSMATGEYIVFFDADDVMLPEKIEHQKKWFSQHPSSEFVYSDLIHFFDGTTRMYHLSIPSLKCDQYKTLLSGNCINPNTVCMKKTLYEKIGGFDEHIRSAEDWDYWLRISRSGIFIGYQPQVLTLYRMRKESLSSDVTTMNITALYVLQKQLAVATDVGTRLLIQKHIQHVEIKSRIITSILRTAFAKIRSIRRRLRLKRYHNETFEHLLKLSLEPYAKR